MEILDEIYTTLVYEKEEEEAGYQWDIKAHKASLEHLSRNFSNPRERDKVWVVVGESNISRKKGDGRFSDSPDGGSEEHVARRTAQDVAIDIPALILIHVNGRDWNATPFWWPVVMAPENTHTTIFSSDTLRPKRIKASVLKPIEAPVIEVPEA